MPPDPAISDALLVYAERALGAGPLAERAAFVLAALPADVRAGLLDDPLFRLTLDDFVPGRGRTVWMHCPLDGRGSRNVVLKPRLAECAAEFAHYIIAHELAHAHLRNGAWGEIADAEHAADALAASWGFERLSRS